MSLTEKYLERLALRKYSVKKGEYHLPTLLALQISHLPRHQELIRLLFKVMVIISDYEADDNPETAQEIIDLALDCITQCEEISDDGLSIMGYEIDETID
ncbi:MAG: hypothetical protein EBR82_72785 [Caulobacteraceae bacterium]|nr:hypothetical protein [Caulobacteraceae bacterium]